MLSEGMFTFLVAKFSDDTRHYCGFLLPVPALSASCSARRGRATASARSPSLGFFFESILEDANEVLDLMRLQDPDRFGEVFCPQCLARREQPKSFATLPRAGMDVHQG